MILAISALLATIGMVLFWTAVWIICLHRPAVSNPDMPRPVFPAGVQYSLSEEFLGKAETWLARLLVYLRNYFYSAAFTALSYALPRLRFWTRQIESRLESVRNAIKGRSEFVGRDGRDPSGFLKDIREHAEESKKNGGVIHEG